MLCGPVVLSIAGRDSTSQAGLDMDVRTIEALGGHALTLQSAGTMQHPGAPMSVEPSDVMTLRDGLRTTLSSHSVGAVKIGMLGTRDIVETVAEGLQDFDGPIVLDPVLFSSSGLCLLEADAYGALEVLSRSVTLVTPNLEEYARLGGDDWRARVGVPVLVKGGHGAGEVLVDQLYAADGAHSTWRHPRRVLQNPRGTGCALSSAIALFLAEEQPLEAAIEQGIAYLKNTF